MDACILDLPVQLDLDPDVQFDLDMDIQLDLDPNVQIIPDIIVQNSLQGRSVRPFTMTRVCPILPIVVYVRHVVKPGSSGRPLTVSLRPPWPVYRV